MQRIENCHSDSALAVFPVSFLLSESSRRRQILQCLTCPPIEVSEREGRHPVGPLSAQKGELRVPGEIRSRVMNNVWKRVRSKPNRIRCSRRAKVEIKGAYFTGIVHTTRDISEKWREIWRVRSQNPFLGSLKSDFHFTFAAVQRAVQGRKHQSSSFGCEVPENLLHRICTRYVMESTLVILNIKS